MTTFEELYNNSALYADEIDYITSCFNSYNKDINVQLSEIDIKKTNKQLLSLVPYQLNDIDNWNFSFSTCATNIIQQLFDTYVDDDDTLIITSKQEHPKVNKILSTYKNILYLVDDGNIINIPLDILMKQIKQAKFVFVYLIGTLCGTGKYTPQIVFNTIKKILMLSKVPHIFVIDAVQELFLLPRDYSMFDYVIGTAHALVPTYDIGFIMSKHNKLTSFAPFAVLKFIKLLNIIKKRQYYLQNFSTYLAKRHSQYANKLNLCINHNVGHLYAIGDKKNTLKPIIPASQNTYEWTNTNKLMYNIYFRATWSLFSYNMLPMLNASQFKDADELDFFGMLYKTDNFLQNISNNET